MFSEQNIALNTSNCSNTNNTNTNNLSRFGGFRLGARCVVEIDGNFFLLLQVILGELDRVFVIRLTLAELFYLLTQGVEVCVISADIPQQMPGMDVDFECTFVVGDNAYLVFIVTNNGTDEIVLVRSELCTIVD